MKYSAVRKADGTTVAWMPMSLIAARSSFALTLTVSEGSWTNLLFPICWGGECKNHLNSNTSLLHQISCCHGHRYLASMGWGKRSMVAKDSHPWASRDLLLLVVKDFFKFLCTAVEGGQLMLTCLAARLHMQL
eukprot:4855802-Amphidinium_carterae.2